jgi:DNA adenine methylase
MFLDPPYDSEFSDYEGKSFTRRDQERLAEALKRTRAKFILVIKNTDFIYGLYEKDFSIFTFDKQYTYNVRSRNERASEHLIITNLPV